MAYNRSIPQPTDLISNSQPSLLANFQAIDSGTTGTGIGFSRNHVTMTDATNGGLHNRVDYFAPVSDPTITGFVSSLYPKGSPAELFYRNVAAIYQLTNLPLVTTTPSANGYGLVTPWGITINWGVIGASGVTPTTPIPLVFQSAFTNSVDSIVCTGLSSNSANSNITVNNPSKTGCNLFCNTTGSCTIYFFVIGH